MRCHLASTSAPQAEGAEFLSIREAAHGSALGQLAYYRALVAKGVLSRSRARQAAAGVRPLAGSHRCEPDRHFEEPPIGFILSMEGAPPILSPSQVLQWYDWGLRIVGPAQLRAQ